MACLPAGRSIDPVAMAVVMVCIECIVEEKVGTRVSLWDGF